MKKNLGKYIKDTVDRYGDTMLMQIRRGLRTDSYTYGQMWEAGLRFRTYLLGKGLRKGDMVLIWAPNMPEWIIALVGCLVSGIVVVPVSMHASVETVDEYIDQTKGTLLIKSKYIKDVPERKIDILSIEDIPDVVSGQEPTDPEEVDSDDLLGIMYTSGTTADPSGVMLTHRNVLVGLEGLKTLIPPSKEYRLLSIMPLSHALEMFLGFYTVINFGASIYYVPKVNPVVIARSLRKYKITHLIVVPQLLKIMFDSIEYRAENEGKGASLQTALRVAPYLPFSLRRILFSEIHRNLGGGLKMFGCAGAPLDKEVAQNWEKVGIAVIEGYGLTETSAGVTANTIFDRKHGSVGRIMSEIEVKFDDDGEIIVKGPSVTEGYFKNRKKTEESFTKDGYFKTGDVGYITDEGYVYLSGRKKFKIVTPSGEKVYPEDVERKLNEHPAVRESCVVGIDKGAGEIVFAAVALKKKVSLEDVIAEVNEGLESHQLILEFGEWMDDDFPRTRTLKKDRSVVKAWAESKIAGKEKDVEEGSDSEDVDKLLSIIELVCDVPVDKIDEDSVLALDFDLDSLRRVALVAMIEEEYGVEVLEEQIGEKTTVAELRKLIANGSKVSTDLSHVTWPLMPMVVMVREFTRRFLIFPLFRLIAPPVEVEGEDPDELLSEPGIIIFNHVGHNEPGMLARALPSTIRKKLTTIADPRSFRSGIRAFLMYFVGAAFPVQKFGGPIRHTLELVADLLEEGWYVMISPEGKRSDDGKLQEFQRGTAVLAVETGVPVYPVKVKGYRDVYPDAGGEIDLPTGKGRVTLVFGEPVRFEPDTPYDEANDTLRKIIEEL